MDSADTITDIIFSSSPVLNCRSCSHNYIYYKLSPGLLFLSVSSTTHRRPQNNPTSNQDFSAISFQRAAREILKPKRGVRIGIFSTKCERRVVVIADEISENLRQFCTELWLSLIDSYSRSVCSCEISKT